MNRVGLKILLKDGHFLAATATEEEYRKLAAGWQEWVKRGRPDELGFLHGDDVFQGQRWDWVAHLSDVVAIHTFAVPSVPGVPAAALGRNLSGLLAA